MNKKILFIIIFLFSIMFISFSQTANIDSLRQIWHNEVDFIAKSIQEKSTFGIEVTGPRKYGVGESQMRDKSTDLDFFL
jgi:hypothetical protein